MHLQALRLGTFLNETKPIGLLHRREGEDSNSPSKPLVMRLGDYLNGESIDGGPAAAPAVEVPPAAIPSPLPPSKPPTDPAAAIAAAATVAANGPAPEADANDVAAVVPAALLPFPELDPATPGGAAVASEEEEEDPRASETAAPAAPDLSSE